MTKSIGELLDNPAEYFGWMHDDAGKFGAIGAVTKLGLFDHIGPEPTSVGQVAERSGLDPESVRRLIEYMAAQGVLDVNEEGLFSPTSRSEFLRSNAHITWGGAHSRAAALHLSDAIKKGITAYEVNFGLPVFEHFKANPELGMFFGQSMSFTTAITEDQLFANHTFKPFDLAVDVGGSQGSLLLRLLSEHPDSRGILFDLPETAEQAKSPVSASSCAGQVEIIGGSFFERVPPGGDLYLLKHILHDWNDEECMKILRNIHNAIKKGGRLVVVERVIPDGYYPHMAYDFDMVMMIWTTGRERRLREFKKMFEASGFAFASFSENPDGMGVIEAMAV